MRLIRIIRRVVFRFVSMFLPRPRGEGYFLYGSAFGFTDNARYLFHYAVEKGDDKARWVASSDNEYSLLQDRGWPVVRTNTIEWLWCWARCERAFVTHGVADVAPVLAKHVLVVNLWHGIPIKYIAFDSATEKTRLQQRQKLRLKTEFWDWDHVVASHPESLRALKSGFRLPESRFIKCQQPRCEWLRNVSAASNKAEDKQRVFLYMPTFRPSGMVTPIADIIQAWQRVYDNTGYMLAVKAHPLDSMDMSDGEVDWIIRPEDLSEDGDATEMLSKADCLISDYSSAIFDFMITRRPILLYCPDEDEYYSSIGGRYMDIKAFSPAPMIFKDVDVLMDHIAKEKFEAVEYEFLNDLYTASGLELASRDWRP